MAESIDLPGDRYHPYQIFVFGTVMPAERR